jgi:hypothetical protein
MSWRSILVFLFLSGIRGDELLTKDEIQKLPIKTLKQMLNERNVQCLGCNEKTHFVDQVFDNQHILPVNKNENNKEKKQKEKSNVDTENIEEVLRSLKNSGFGDAKVFTANDFKNMKADDLNEKLKNQQKPSSKKRRKNVDIDLDDL